MRSRLDDEALDEQLLEMEDAIGAIRRALSVVATAIEQLAIDLYEEDGQARLAACGQAEDIRAIAGWADDW